MALATRMMALAAAADGVEGVYGVTHPYDAAPEGSRVAGCRAWLTDLREQYRRRPTVREELDRGGPLGVELSGRTVSVMDYLLLTAQ